MRCATRHRDERGGNNIHSLPNELLSHVEISTRARIFTLQETAPAAIKRSSFLARGTEPIIKKKKKKICASVEYLDTELMTRIITSCRISDIHERRFDRYRFRVIWPYQISFSGDRCTEADTRLLRILGDLSFSTYGSRYRNGSSADPVKLGRNYALTPDASISRPVYLTSDTYT